MLSVDEQMRIITSGAAQIVPEADLRKKLEKGEPLNIKLGVDPTSPDLHLGHAPAQDASVPGPGPQGHPHHR